MSTEVQRYQPPATVAERAPTEIDQWVLVVRDVSILAGQIADTQFVPESMRGNPAAILAAILAGREAGVGPMTALQHIHIVKGKPGQSAQLMRQLVLSAGHAIRFIETTDTRCIIEGKRRGEEQWERVTFTADQARRAGIDLGKYPEDKLVARASVRLCRRKFADCIGGMPYSIDELEDGDALPDGDEPPAEPPVVNAHEGRRTARRRTPNRASTDRVEQPKPEATLATAEPKSEQAGPPLPGEDGYEGAGGPESARHEQLAKMHVQLDELGVTGRADKLTVVGLLIRRPDLASSKEMTKSEASGVIDLFERLLAEAEPARALDAALAALEDQSADSVEDGAT